MKIAAIFPSEIKQDVEIDMSTEQPLGIAYVVQAAKNAGYDTKLYYGLPSLEELVEFDVMAFSSLTKDIPATLDISTKVKKLEPGIVTVIGGSHISGDHGVVLEDSIDYGVVGEGEETFVELLNHLDNPEDVRGIVYIKGGEIVFTGYRERLDPTGLRPMRVDDFYKVYDPSLYYPAPSIRRFIPIIGSRGCNKGCEFCDSELIWGKKVLYRTPKDVITEIEELYQSKNDIFFFDDNNMFFNRLTVEEIIGNLREKDYNIASSGDLRLMDDKLLKLIKQAGWTTLLWGIESINPNVLGMEKKGSTPEKVYNVLSQSEKVGIFNHGMSMIGFDFETEESILKYGKELVGYPIHQVRLAIATPFIGTKFYQRLQQQGHLFDPDLSKWDTGHLVYDHPTISPERMKELQHEIVTGFYKSPQWDKRMQDMSKRFPHLKQSISEFRDYISLSLK